MGRLFRKLLIFALPFVTWAGLVCLIDPYEYFRAASGPAAQRRARIAVRTDGPLQRLIAFRRRPRQHVLLGDSRMASLPENLVTAAIGEPAENLAYGGGSLNEAIQTFWITNERAMLKSVTIGVNIDLFNDANAKDRVGPAGTLIRHPELYLCDRLVGLTVWTCLVDAFSRRGATPGRPPMTPEAFWDYQLNVTARTSLGSYRDPAGYRARLGEIATECRRKGIHLVFIIFPEHQDLQEMIRAAGLAEAAASMPGELGAFGDVHDFRARPEWTGHREKFIDPYHFREAIGAELIRTVWAAPDSARPPAPPVSGMPGPG